MAVRDLNRSEVLPALLVCVLLYAAMAFVGWLTEPDPISCDRDRLTTSEWIERVADGDCPGPDVTYAPAPTGIRTGAICRDGWVSRSTGAGTCSHHGGVARWTHRPR